NIGSDVGGVPAVVSPRTGGATDVKNISASSQSLGGFDLLACLLVIGYLLMSRSFSHWGFPPFYISEVALGAFILAQPASVTQPLLGSLVGPSRISTIGWVLAFSLIYGIVHCLCAITAGPATLAIAEVFVFHIYPLYLLIGMWVGTRQPDIL